MIDKDLNKSKDVHIIKKLWRAARAGAEHFKADQRWPRPRVKLKSEPHFLFIVTPPYSGSTALAQTLNSCKRSCFLQRRAEGQWLVPGMCDRSRAWKPKAYMNWDSIQAVWRERYKLISETVHDREIVIEKSPPNLLRMDQLVNAFPNNTVFAFNRNPFANCASILYRRHDPQKKTEAQRIEVLKQLASDWLFRSIWVKRWIDEMNLLYFSYEQFCSEPAFWISKLVDRLPVLESVDLEKNIKVKDYREAKLENHNKRQIDKLSQNEVAAISTVLAAQEELVNFFGYDSQEACGKS